MTGRDQELLEREVEATLARLATRAVPDTERPPAPPWRSRRRSVDPRRFGRATPWLVAAVLLVIAGLGVGASVAFDASAPDRGPVMTDPPSPSPTATVTVPDGTLGTPVSTPTSPPTLARDPNGNEPDDGVSTSPSTMTDSGALIAGIGTYGPLRTGMNESEAMLATGIHEGAFGEGPTYCRSREIPVDGRPPFHGTIIARDGKVIGFEPTPDAVDAHGLGVGATLAQVRAAYPTGTLDQSSGGWVFTVVDGGDGLGFGFGVDQPADTDVVDALLPGTADFARGFELCSG